MRQSLGDRMRDPYAIRHAQWGVGELLDRFPEVSIRPSTPGVLTLAGAFDFQTRDSIVGTISDSFSLELRIPQSFPCSFPEVRETGGRIPKAFHTLTGGQLCLGSPLRLRAILTRHPTIYGFVETCILPYLVGFAIFERTGKMPFGELAHGRTGLLDDYKAFFGVSDSKTCIGFLDLLGLKKRVANKRACPCASGRRVGRCHNRKINRLRQVATRFQFREIAAHLHHLK